MEDIPNAIESEAALYTIKKVMDKYKGQTDITDALFETACVMFDVSQDKMLEIMDSI